jgi:hypothetical protein
MADDFDRSFDFFASHAASESFQNTTIDSDNFQYSVTKQEPVFDKQNILFPDFESDFFSLSTSSTVRVAIQEQLSAMYDDFSQEGSITVTGSVHILPTTNATSSPLNLLIKDSDDCIQRVEDASENCQTNDSGNGTFTLRVNCSDLSSQQETRLVNYFCAPKLRPVPIVSVQ